MLNNIHIAMVETLKAGNIGSAARAMKTMGLNNLLLINPKQFPHKDANIMAVHAKDVVQSAEIHPTLTEAIADKHLIIGTSARNRTMPITAVSAAKASDIAMQYASKGKKVLFVFGREDAGLTNSEMLDCHLHMYIDADENYGVLNVAAAVQITSYLLHQSFLQAASAKQETSSPHPKNKTNKPTVIGPFGQRWDEPLCTDVEFNNFIEHLEQVLIDLNVYNKSKSPHLLMPRFKRMFKRIHLDTTEAGLLRGMLTAIDRKVLGKIKPNQSKKTEQD